MTSVQCFFCQLFCPEVALLLVEAWALSARLSANLLECKSRLATTKLHAAQAGDLNRVDCMMSGVKQSRIGGMPVPALHKQCLQTNEALPTKYLQRKPESFPFSTAGDLEICQKQTYANCRHVLRARA